MGIRKFDVTFVAGNGVLADDLNDLVDAVNTTIDYTNALQTDIDNTDANNVGVANVEIVNGHFKFNNLKGNRGYGIENVNIDGLDFNFTLENGEVISSNLSPSDVLSVKEVGVDDTPTSGSDNLVSSGAVYNFIRDNVYPVGSLYMSFNNDSPASKFGGNWLKLENTFLLASGDRNASSTGGSKTFTLTTNNLPNHTHAQSYPYNGSYYAMSYTTTSGSVGGYSSVCPDGTIKNNGTNIGEARTFGTGNGQSVEHLPPYTVINIWRRTA